MAVAEFKKKPEPPAVQHAGKISRHSIPISPSAESLWADIRKYGLEANIGELEVRGFTVVPPEKALPPGMAERLKAKIMDVAERRSGVRPDERAGTTHSLHPSAFGERLTYLLFEDQIFQDVMCNPVAGALVRYLVGENAVASNCMALLKGPGEGDLLLHADNALVHTPFPPNQLVCNVTYALTDYTHENGALCFVPGSHKFYRHPTFDEGLDQRVAVECPAGSLIFWGGNTWHGAFARTAPGLRVNLLMAFLRPYMRPQEAYREDVTQEILARNPPIFSRFMGQHINYGWREEGPQNESTTNFVARHAYD